MNNIDKYLLATRIPPCISLLCTVHAAKYAIEKFTSISKKKKNMAALGSHYTVFHSDQLCGAQQVRCHIKQLLNGDRRGCTACKHCLPS